MKPEIIVRVQFPSAGIAMLEEDFVVHYVPTLEEFEQAISSFPETRGLLTNGSIGVTADQLARLPKLEMIQTQGVGYENVDFPTVEKRKLVLATGKGTNAFSVADHAMALMLGITRNLVWADQKVRAGEWLKARAPVGLAWQKRLGIMGLGEIGLQIAERAQGFRMKIAYHNRNKRSDVDFDYYSDPIELARNCDFVISVMPGGAGTKGLIGRDFLDALGPTGYVINIGRGTTVDTDELVKALHEGRIAGAALDVVAGEPTVPDNLIGAPNLIITPHIGGRSPESVSEALNRVSHNFKAHFAGEPLISRVA